MNIEKLKRYVGAILACLLLAVYWMDKGHLYGKPRLTFLDETILSQMIYELNFDYALISAYHSFDIECGAGYKERNSQLYIYKQCDEPERFVPLIAYNRFSRIVDSSSELEILLDSLGWKLDGISSDGKVRYEETLSKAARDYARSRISSVKALVYVVHVAWFIFFLIVLRYRENIGGTTLHILRTLFVAVSGLFRAIRRLFKELHSKV